jgi:hypothetical protein
VGGASADQGIDEELLAEANMTSPHHLSVSLIEEFSPTSFFLQQ